MCELLDIVKLPIYVSSIHEQNLELEQAVQNLLYTHPEGWMSNWGHIAGVWTSANLHDNILDKLDVMHGIRAQIQTHCNVYAESLQVSQVTPRIVNSQIDVIRPGQLIEKHNHMHTTPTPPKFSGIYFINSPESAGELEIYNPLASVIRMWQPSISHQSINTQLKPRDGMIVIFPAWLDIQLHINRSINDVICTTFDCI